MEEGPTIGGGPGGLGGLCCGVARQLRGCAARAQKFQYTGDIQTALQTLQKAGKLSKWGKACEDLRRRQTLMGELRMVRAGRPGRAAAGIRPRLVPCS